MNEKIDKIYNKYEKHMKAGGMSFCIESGDGSFHWQRESGNMANNRPFGIASVSKLFTTTLILKLVDDGKIALNGKLSLYLPAETIDRLAVYKGIDYSASLTVRNLLAQTSGLPDYYTEALRGDICAANKESDDPVTILEEELCWIKKHGNCFPPDKKHKAHYSDTNFDLLGVIIERATGISFAECVNRFIAEPLGLERTEVFSREHEIDFSSIWYKGQIVLPLNVLQSGPASGGIISTRSELMTFIKAFWNGRLFSANHLDEMKVYNPIQFIPLQYGVGHMKFAQIGCPVCIGHSGSTGVVCYYVPKNDLFAVGTINECAEAKAIRIMVRLLLQSIKEITH